MFRSVLPTPSALRSVRPRTVLSSPVIQAPSLSLFARRGYASQSDDLDLVIIGGGVAGYVAAIKAGQEGLKARFFFLSLFRTSLRLCLESAFKQNMIHDAQRMEIDVLIHQN